MSAADALIWLAMVAVFGAAWAGIVAFGWFEDCAMRRLCKLPEITFMDYLRGEEWR